MAARRVFVYAGNENTKNIMDIYLCICCAPNNHNKINDKHKIYEHIEHGYNNNKTTTHKKTSICFQIRPAHASHNLMLPTNIYCFLNKLIYSASRIFIIQFVLLTLIGKFVYLCIAN